MINYIRRGGRSGRSSDGFFEEVFLMVQMGPKNFRSRILISILIHASSEAQIREQMSGPDLHVFTLKFLALKKTGFFSIKNTFQFFF